jgi:acyl-homoserine lactone acylase PvdQ
VLAYGQTSDRDSPHSRDQIRLFASHELRPVLFSEAEIEANLERRYRP